MPWCFMPVSSTFPHASQRLGRLRCDGRPRLLPDQRIVPLRQIALFVQTEPGIFRNHNADFFPSNLGRIHERGKVRNINAKFALKSQMPLGGSKTLPLTPGAGGRRAPFGRHHIVQPVEARWVIGVDRRHAVRVRLRRHFVHREIID